MEYISTSGRRKTSVARIYFSKGEGNYSINGRDFKNYFPAELLQIKVAQPFKITDTAGKFDIKANVTGGGQNGQAEAIRLAIAKALCKQNPEFRPALKKEGLLKRDPRMVERKKFGQKKARKRFQFSKR